MERTITLYDSSQPAESPHHIPSLGDSQEIDEEPFPFMRLPIEIRNMIYTELLVQSVPVTIYASHTYPEGCRRAVVTPAYRRRWGTFNGAARQTSFSPEVFRQLSLTSRGIYRESASIYFAHNTFEFEDLECVPKFLGKLSSDSRRAIATIKLSYVGKAPAAAFKMLATCVGLRRLQIMLEEYDTFLLMRRSHRSVMKLTGLGDCLKLRGLTHVAVDRHGCEQDFIEEFYADLPKFREALQVLKQPQDPARLARLDKKDYPNKLHRSVFGKANVTTRMENKVMGTTPQ